MWPAPLVKPRWVRPWNWTNVWAQSVTLQGLLASVGCKQFTRKISRACLFQLKIGGCTVQGYQTGCLSEKHDGKWACNRYHRLVIEPVCTTKRGHFSSKENDLLGKKWTKGSFPSCSWIGWCLHQRLQCRSKDLQPLTSVQKAPLHRLKPHTLWMEWGGRGGGCSKRAVNKPDVCLYVYNLNQVSKETFPPHLFMFLICLDCPGPLDLVRKTL